MKLEKIVIVFLMCVSGCTINNGEKSSITAVEHGLRYKILIDNDKNQYMTITERMAYYKTPAASIAVINDGKLAWAHAYGYRASGVKKIDTNTLFQAASISKSLTAIGALILVQQGKLSLDENINNYLKSWKVPDNKFTKKEKVTLRRLLCHSAGTSLASVGGFSGYQPGIKIPNTVEILEGKKPQANSGPVRVLNTPGKEYSYSGGGIIIVQLLIEELTGEKFDVWMKKNVLEPFGMHASTFSQPLPEKEHEHAAYGHDAMGKQLIGKWRIHPEMASSGLWSTPTDLAHFAITILKILHGQQAGPISQELLREALKPQIYTSKNDSHGLGFFLWGSENTLSFGHAGQNEGFTCDLRVWPELGKGLIIMVNNHNATGLLREISNSISDVYKIPGFEPIIKHVINQSLQSLLSYNKCTGVYKDHDHVITVNIRNDRLFITDSYVDELRDMQLYPAGDNIFFTRELKGSLQFLGAHDKIDKIVLLDKDGKIMVDENKKECVLKRSK